MENFNEVITISEFVRKPVEEVWEYFTNPLHIINWNFATDNWYCPHAENELKANGKFSYTMSSKDGKISFNFSGTFKEIIYLKYISYYLDDGRFVEISFDQAPQGVLIKQTFEAEKVYPIELQKNGWQAIFKNFRIYVERR